MLAAAREGPLDVFVARDLAFHAIFYERSGHRRLLRSWQALEPSFRTLLTISNLNPRLGEVLQMHRRILNAVKARDAAAAQRWVRAHLAQAQPIIAEAYARFQQAEPSRARR
jgi:DNA-binding GntR family transcriptional regulator